MKYDGTRNQDKPPTPGKCWSCGTCWTCGIGGYLTRMLDDRFLCNRCRKGLTGANMKLAGDTFAEHAASLRKLEGE